MPPYLGDYNRMRITITIPKESKLFVKDLRIRTDIGNHNIEEKILYHAHEGFFGLCGPSTAFSFEMAGRMGYRSCITIPKFTKDGVAVCFHDDDTIRKRLRYIGGNKIEEGSLDDRPISFFTYDELMKFDAGIRKNRIFAGEKIPTLDNFFEICAKYKMMPVLSIHPDSEYSGIGGIDKFTRIRELSEKHGLLTNLRIKSGNPMVLRAALSVFGRDIAGYILVQAPTASWDTLSIAKESGFVHENADSILESKYSIVLEYYSSVVTNEKIVLAKQEGFPVSIFTTGKGISGAELKRLIDLGVSEFTINNHCSMGLNW